MSGFLGEQFRDNERINKWNDLYQRLTSEAFGEQIKFHFTSNVAQLPQNLRLNRYGNVLPYDHSLLQLSNGAYVNANYLHVQEAERCYILTQGPLSLTASQFWQMVWEHSVHCIIMLTNVFEMGSRKCCMYFPGSDKSPDGKNTGNLLTYGDFRINLLQELDTANYTIRNFALTNLKVGLSRDIKHYQYTNWPDFGCPRLTDNFLEFLFKIRKNNSLYCSISGPVVCHCSAGIGRTGTFVLIDLGINIAQKLDDLEQFDIVSLAVQCRRARSGLIQTPQQLRFAHMAIMDALDDPKWDNLLKLNHSEVDDGLRDMRNIIRPLTTCPTSRKLNASNDKLFEQLAQRLETSQPSERAAAPKRGATVEQMRPATVAKVVGPHFRESVFRKSRPTRKSRPFTTGQNVERRFEETRPRRRPLRSDTEQRFDAEVTTSSSSSSRSNSPGSKFRPRHKRPRVFSQRSVFDNAKKLTPDGRSTSWEESRYSSSRSTRKQRERQNKQYQ